MYRSLNVPVSRLEQESSFSLGRTTEISRDEIKFQKFIDRLRRRFSGMFLNTLKKQLILKQIITEEDWDNWKNDIVVDYIRDNHFTEMRDAELMRERLQTMDMIQQYIGQFYSKTWVMKNVLMLDDEEVENMKKDMAEEENDNEIPVGDEPQVAQEPQDGENNDN